MFWLLLSHFWAGVIYRQVEASRDEDPVFRKKLKSFIEKDFSIIFCWTFYIRSKVNLNIWVLVIIPDVELQFEW